MERVKLGVAGLGGYAGVITRLLLDESESRSSMLTLTAVCEPDLATHATFAANLQARGIQVVPDYEAFLATSLDAVWLPLPIPLHRPYTERALAAGKAVMCEKPAAGCIQDLDAMRDARDHAGLPVAIGFQDIYKPSTTLLKRALLTGRIGNIRSATVCACWPRDTRYYGRSTWAGTIRQSDAWVLDSPANNALAHFLNLALYLLGDAEVSAEPGSVEAELYRVNAIENYDTCALRVHTEAGVPLLVLFTHACKNVRDPRIVIIGDRGQLIYHAGQTATIESDGTVETISLREETQHEMVGRFVNLVQNVPDERAVATLEIARAHLIAVNGASEAAVVQSVPAEFVKSVPNEGSILLTIPNIESLFDQCVKEQKLPHEIGVAAWTSPAASKDLQGYDYFSGPKVT